MLNLSATQLRQFSTVLPGGRTFFAKISAKISYRENESFRENLKFSQNFFVFAKSFAKIAYIFHENFLENEKRRSALYFRENIFYTNFCKNLYFNPSWLDLATLVLNDTFRSSS
jgi:hypothetical protein